MSDTSKPMQQNTSEITENANSAKEATASAKEALEANKVTLKIGRDMKASRVMNKVSIVAKYVSVTARDGLAASVHNMRNQGASTVQTLREISDQRASEIQPPERTSEPMSPHNLNARIDRAIDQSDNEYISKLKAVSVNQLKSGDLSIKTATTQDIEALRQFADDWETRIGNGAAVRIPTYRVLVQGIRTTYMNMDQPAVTRQW